MSAVAYDDFVVVAAVLLWWWSSSRRRYCYSVHFNGRFPVQLGYPVPECLHSGFIGAKMMEMVVTTGAIR